MQKTIFNPNEPISEEVVVLEHKLFGKPQSILSHPRFCMCIACRQHYGEELDICAEQGCIFPSYTECDLHYCYKHHKAHCDND